TKSAQHLGRHCAFLLRCVFYCADSSIIGAALISSISLSAWASRHSFLAAAASAAANAAAAASAAANAAAAASAAANAAADAAADADASANAAADADASTRNLFQPSYSSGLIPVAAHSTYLSAI